MRTTVLPARTTRRIGGACAVVLMGALLVGCGQENDGKQVSATDPGESTSTATETPTSSATAGGTGSAAPVSGDLPAWAPAIRTDEDDNVVGLDFTDVPEPSDELLVAEVRTGDGPPVESGQTITADYFGQLPGTDGPFDSSYGIQPFQAPIGQGMLIKGWDEGLVGVPVGSRVIMSVPPDLGYGADGYPPQIPGDATLYFVIDIIAAA
ncbi:hypothetical protein BH11ACT8_BH11ACT8_17440 [soil metagenome]